MLILPRRRDESPATWRLNRASRRSVGDATVAAGRPPCILRSRTGASREEPDIYARFRPGSPRAPGQRNPRFTLCMTEFPGELVSLSTKPSKFLQVVIRQIDCHRRRFTEWLRSRSHDLSNPALHFGKPPLLRSTFAPVHLLSPAAG